MNMKRLMYKLQTALCAKGTLVKINQRQSWSEHTQRMITKYIIKEDGHRDSLFESYRIHEVVRFLADLLNGGDNE